MPRISFSFRGWGRDVFNEATDAEGNIVDVSQMCPFELADALNKKKLFAEIDVANSCGDIEITDFEGLI